MENVVNWENFDFYNVSVSKNYFSFSKSAVKFFEGAKGLNVVLEKVEGVINKIGFIAVKEDHGYTSGINKAQNCLRVNSSQISDIILSNSNGQNRFRLQYDGNVAYLDLHAARKLSDAL
jgi:hypothetical protein